MRCELRRGEKGKRSIGDYAEKREKPPFARLPPFLLFTSAPPLGRNAPGFDLTLWGVSRSQNPGRPAYAGHAEALAEKLRGECKR